MGALVFMVALLPGWVAEQDPWQKIWAARDERSAKRGLLLGAALLALVYFCCLLTAIGPFRALSPACRRSRSGDALPEGHQR